MKVKMLWSGKTEDYGTEYACRLIEQGSAVPAPDGQQNPSSVKARRRPGAQETE